jgi:hypothetical protein
MVSSYSLSADVTHGCGRGLNEDDWSRIGMDRHIGVGVALYRWSPALAGKLEDLLLENKQITIDQWVQLKAEKRSGKRSL